MFDLTISSKRLTLRPFRLRDAPRARALANNYDIAKMVGSIPRPYPDGLAEKWIAVHDARRASGNGYPFAVELGGALIGSVGVERENGDFELGYWLGAEYWGRGYATERSRVFHKVRQAEVKVTHPVLLRDLCRGIRYTRPSGCLAAEKIKQV